MQNNLNTLPTDHKSEYFNDDLKLKLKICLNSQLKTNHKMRNCV